MISKIFEILSNGKSENFKIVLNGNHGYWNENNKYKSSIYNWNFTENDLLNLNYIQNFGLFMGDSF